jgi:DNA-directed RNA polymerase specialized sigma24 family protein
LKEELDEYISLKAEAIRLINSLPDSRHRLVLMHRYINGHTWEQIAVCMHYTYQWVHCLHGKALREFEKVMEHDKS